VNNLLKVELQIQHPNHYAARPHYGQVAVNKHAGSLMRPSPTCFQAPSFSFNTGLCGIPFLPLFDTLVKDLLNIEPMRLHPLWKTGT